MLIYGRKSKVNRGPSAQNFPINVMALQKERRLVACQTRLIQLVKPKRYFLFHFCEFFCYVTNLKMSAFQIHKCYGKRSTSENWIEWCKNHLASGLSRTQDFWANSAIFLDEILAYNLRVWMMWLNTATRFHLNQTLFELG
jgi:hypothetical protein